MDFTPIFEAKADIFKPGCGWLPDDWMPLDSIRKALRSAARSPDDCLMGYSTPLGLPALRDLLARRAQAKVSMQILIKCF